MRKLEKQKQQAKTKKKRKTTEKGGDFLFREKFFRREWKKEKERETSEGTEIKIQNGFKERGELTQLPLGTVKASRGRKGKTSLHI